MRILMVHDEPIEGGYGAESYVRRLVAGLRATGDEVEVIAGEVTHEGVGRLRDIWDPRARDLVDRRSQRFRPDVIHFHNITRELSPSVLRAATGVPAVMTVHDFRILGAHEHPAFSVRGRVERLVAGAVRRMASRRLSATIGVSHRVSDALRRRGFPRVSTVRVPVAVPVATPRRVAECRDVAVVARLARDKGVDIAISAFEKATNGRPAGHRILVAGDGPERRRLETQVSAPHLHGRVELLGRLRETEISALLGKIRVVVVASQPRHRPEGSSLAVAEAAMHGRAVVASSDPAVREVADELGVALVVPSWEIDGFASALVRLLDDDELTAELGARGRENAVRLHSIDAVVAATREVYDAAMAAT